MRLIPIIIKNNNSEYGRTAMIEQEATLRDLQSLVEKIYSVPEECQILFFKEKRLLDSLRTLEEYGIEEYSHIGLYQKLPDRGGELHILYKRTSGEMMVLNARYHYTVEDVKKYVCKIEGVDPNLKSLFSSCVELVSEYKSLGELRFRDGSIIHLE
ncbi:uncharacterized protein B0P05DRAFT_550047 [Gilbertella persicaria]|uniref:uncharacterized protein n=1 Tax=Gilbertella persicaria TaxID=101096 RepID=UPI00221FD71B|nr:uncharacterized protein B0P05DRAFT_550047 [Gilbertella persicaria]KAI8070525.1 hypothetical protein B0P05DRAFT_550047 [Gilbertella persicaria]